MHLSHFPELLNQVQQPFVYKHCVSHIKIHMLYIKYVHKNRYSVKFEVLIYLIDVSLSTWPTMDDKFLVRITLEITSYFYGVSNRTQDFIFPLIIDSPAKPTSNLSKGINVATNTIQRRAFRWAMLAILVWQLIGKHTGFRNQIDNFDF